jgi:hypothetical protein
MRSRSLLIPTIVAATAAFGVSGTAFSDTRDAQVQAAELLSRTHASETLQSGEQRDARPSLAAVEAQASAAALLSGRSIGGETTASIATSAPTVAREAVDAHVQAAALLSGSRTADRESSRLTGKVELGEHPAVLVARQWKYRRIDPNAFIVAHPARLQLVAGSPRE